jgi:hypothetical protein
LLGFLANNQGAQNRARSSYETSVAQAMADRVLRAQQDLANNPPVVPDAAAADVVDMSGAVNAPVANATAAAQRAAIAAGLRRRRASTGARIGRI